jgi:hypothetical protein
MWQTFKLSVWRIFISCARSERIRQLQKYFLSWKKRRTNKKIKSNALWNKEESLELWRLGTWRLPSPIKKYQHITLSHNIGQRQKKIIHCDTNFCLYCLVNIIFMHYLFLLFPSILHMINSMFCSFHYYLLRICCYFLHCLIRFLFIWEINPIHLSGCSC